MTIFEILLRRSQAERSRSLGVSILGTSEPRARQAHNTCARLGFFKSHSSTRKIFAHYKIDGYLFVNFVFEFERLQPKFMRLNGQRNNNQNKQTTYFVTHRLIRNSPNSNRDNNYCNFSVQFTIMFRVTLLPDP